MIDAPRTISANECVYVRSKKGLLTHLSSSSQTSFQFDEFVSSYEQVNTIGQAMATRFVQSKQTHKVVLNLADQFATNNNCGFNFANFKPKFIRDFFPEVATDYERSFVGSFAKSLLA